jgi:hypothetical protein
MREPPADWFISAYFKYEPPEKAIKRKDGTIPTQIDWSSYSKAVQNTIEMGRLMGLENEKT